MPLIIETDAPQNARFFAVCGSGDGVRTATGAPATGGDGGG